MNKKDYYSIQYNLTIVIIALVLYALNIIHVFNIYDIKISLSVPLLGRLLMLYVLWKLRVSCPKWKIVLFYIISFAFIIVDLACLIGIKTFYHLSFTAIEMFLIVSIIKQIVFDLDTLHELKETAKRIHGFVFVIFSVQMVFAMVNLMVLYYKLVNIPLDARNALAMVFSQPYYYFSASFVMAIAMIILVFKVIAILNLKLMNGECST